MRFCWLVIPMLVIALAAGLRGEQKPTTQPAAQEINETVSGFMKDIEAVANDDPLRRKLKERHNSLVRILELRVQGYRKGVNDAAPIFDAVNDVAEAKMALAENKDERVKLAEQLVDVTKFVEKRAEKQLKGGFGSEVDLERARVLRETAEIKLLELKPSSPAQKPAQNPPPTTEPHERPLR